MTHQFELGQVVTTAEIYEAMQEHRGFKLDVMEALLKYRNRDWGDTSDGDKERWTTATAFWQPMKQARAVSGSSPNGTGA